jgi:hypothetical protein
VVLGARDEFGSLLTGTIAGVKEKREAEAIVDVGGFESEEIFACRDASSIFLDHVCIRIHFGIELDGIGFSRRHDAGLRGSFL